MAELDLLKWVNVRSLPAPLATPLLVFEDSSNCQTFRNRAPNRPFGECPLIRFVPRTTQERDHSYLVPFG